jgi:L-alanine-DL-glutamate epimerase-like enolase superfamily enzyme
MRIRSVRPYLLSYPLPEPLTLTYPGGERTIVKRDAMFIRVEADHGLIGYGPAPGTERAKSIVERVIAPFLAGRTLADTDALRVHFLEECGRDTEQQKLYGAVEIALYDLIGKEQGLSVSELLGGRMRDRIRLYASAGMHTTPEKHAEEAHAVSQLGFRAYKMHSGIGPEQDLETVRRMRDAVGADFDLIVDAHTWWQIGDRNYVQATIDKLAEQLGQHNIAWLEEPLPPASHEGYRRLKELDLVPLASGVHEPDEPGFLDLILSDSVDYLQLDLVSQGGYPTARRMLGEISRAGMRLAFHSWGTALEVIAAAHVGVCWPDQIVEWLEYPCYSTPTRAGMYAFPLAGEVLKQPLDLDHGDLILPKLPGLGVEVDESVIERYPWIPGPWSFVRTDSPLENRAITGSLAERWSRKAPGSMDSRQANRQAS